MICIILWIFGYLQYALLQHMAERISFDLRSRYLRNLLNQEIEFYETQQIEALPSKIGEYFEAISNGVGEKIGQVVFGMAMGFGGLVIAMAIAPVYSILCILYIPIFGVLIGAFMKIVG